jgi:hypothetical protein
MPPAVRDLVMLIAQVEAPSPRLDQLEKLKGADLETPQSHRPAMVQVFVPQRPETHKTGGRQCEDMTVFLAPAAASSPRSSALKQHSHCTSNCRRFEESFTGEDPEPHCHQVVGIPKIEFFVIRSQLNRLMCPHCPQKNAPSGRRKMREEAIP